ncbi:primosomal protein N' [Glaciecola sp. MH2013]|uniref:primosomal protein N' n=1 Tax=Glaciecola sp. MH2013 TaxID=2785524 RepID=UPI00189FAD47|nr:primosomal protein N' [Glaciecola sp. MH2013]MBF7071864.1 primosomal protein N' [Glaciecola sp. MH2013]
MQIAQVAIPVPMYQLFHYEIMLSTTDIIGARVLVPFGPRKVLGIVVNLVTVKNDEQAAQLNINLKKLRAVERILDDCPVLSEHMMTLAQWMSDFYHHPIGEVMHTLLPASLRKHQDGKARPSVQSISYYRLSSNQELHLHASELVARSRKQGELYTSMQQATDHKCSVHELKESFSASVIKALLDKGLIEKYDEAVKPGLWQSSLKIDTKPVPNIEQSIAISTISMCTSFDTFLIEGVTGSGKTEVYLQIIEPLLEVGKQVLILVPEIGLTPQTVKRFERRFNTRVGVLHSNLNDSDRLSVWQQAREGSVGIVIGTRSSIFTQLKNPGMIIVDEEHDESFKQQDNLKYHARDIAVYRANKLNIPLVLGSATPSLESLHNALEKKYKFLSLPNRAGSASMPSQRLMDVKSQKMQFGIAQGMLDKMKQHLENGNQVMVFVNRRGYAPALLCHQCGFVEFCERCDNPMTVHKIQHHLQCHRCSDVRYLPSQCRECGASDMDTFGYGTEQLQQGLSELFPEYNSIRIDSDSVRGKGKLDRLLKEINQKQYQILVGTQILSKGHHFPDVTFVLILDVDSALFSADFRAPEKLAQLITQLAGRAGRSDKSGEMWLQTHCPEHPLLQDLINNGYSDFARYALLERKHAGLPPHEFQVCIRSESHKKGLANQFLILCAETFTQFKHAKVLGPFPAAIEKRQGRYRFNLIIQSASRKYLQEITKQANAALIQLPIAKQVRWSIDVLPTDFS